MSFLPTLSRRLLSRDAASLLRTPLPLAQHIRHTSTATEAPKGPPPPPSSSSPSSSSLPAPLRHSSRSPATGTPSTSTSQATDLATLQTYHTALLHQPPWYTTIHIHSYPYLVTLGDSITLPALLYPPRDPVTNPLNKPLQPGDSIRLTHASTLGSRDYTIKGAPFIDPRLFNCRAIVVEVTAEPMRFKEKTKRRQRRVKTVKSKHRYTVLRICELAVNRLPEEFTPATATTAAEAAATGAVDSEGRQVEVVAAEEEGEDDE
ncbi:hypothetical protein DRE_04800 [Drechslerella stenobrocha 248]|uniref:Large ribosomal subunit protein bL21m n=1 Tax=Drechslerella stenobrocha 248 TaxID=1043628 RepID=W7I0L4_9PEZI|nr:hypothetical protein DRE_04800 [Drechslerella stenobrocha 248]